MNGFSIPFASRLSSESLVRGDADRSFVRYRKPFESIQSLAKSSSIRSRLGGQGGEFRLHELEQVVAERTDPLPPARTPMMDAAHLVRDPHETDLLVERSDPGAGVRIAVDDFGSGYSSLASLRTFPADILKIDGTLVRDVGRVDGGDDPMVRSIIQLAHSLDLSVCAEWVTSDDQLQRLRVLGCDMVQGNRIGAASPADEFARRLSLRRAGGMQAGQPG